MTYTVAVRSLCEFVAKTGDLDLRFTPSPTALEGIEGHQAVTSRRPPHYQTELTLSGQCADLLVRGRADGYDPQDNRLEEIKTHRGDLGLQPANHRALHWAQAKVYGWLLCYTERLSELTVALVYYDVATGHETRFDEHFSAHQLSSHFESTCHAFMTWARQETAHHEARSVSLRALTFPFAELRPGQRTLAEDVYKAIRTEKPLLVQAPTGIGKTLGTLFPALKSLTTEGDQPPVDKVFFLAAKTAGRQLALDGLQALNQGAAQSNPLRTLELIARDKACEHPDRACHGDACPLAKGFYDRLPEARREAVQAGMLDQQTLRTIALKHEICPYYLSQELARWADVIVGDYNYFFDSRAVLYALTRRLGWRTVVLVDEAHNLVSRARAMYSAELTHQSLQQARQQAPKPVRPALVRLQQQWQALLTHSAGNDNTPADYVALTEPPEDLLRALAGVIEAWGDYRNQHPTVVNTPVQTLYFQALQLQRLNEAFDDRSLYDLQRTGPDDATLCLRNCIPDRFLADRFNAAASVVLFSATLSPPDYYRRMLGLPAHTVTRDVPAPFRADQLRVTVVDSVSTRFHDRAGSIGTLVDTMARQYHRQPGNYLAYFSSYAYLNQVSERLQLTHPDLPHWCQAAGMTEAARRQFLARFHAGNQGIGLAVLGGVFGEGIDLPGDRLIGAFVATLGLPQWNAVNEAMRERMSAVFDAGYEYTYLYPGLQKVVQAAGRVIRSEQDAGVLYLFDDRYRQPDIQALFPAWWPEPKAETMSAQPGRPLPDLAGDTLAPGK